MLRAALRLMSRAPKSSSARLRPISVRGLSEHPTVWPVPLPPPLAADVGKPTLVLDIDETLLHTYAMGPAPSSNGSGGMGGESGSEEDNMSCFSIFFLPRPHLRQFLTEVKEMYEVVFWTAGTASYCSAVLDALEEHVLQMPRSMYGCDEIIKAARGLPSTSHVNFYALSRTQTLEQHHYMKYIPILGRPMNRVIMVDDNERSFPLTPRHGIKISPFLVNDTVMQRYSRAVALSRGGHVSAHLQADVSRGAAELARLEADRALLDLLPMLRAVAAVPKGEDVARELDYWRDGEYVRCDDFHETMNPHSVARRKILGTVLSNRREAPIPPLKNHMMNHAFTHEAKVFMDEMFKKTNICGTLQAKL